MDVYQRRSKYPKAISQMIDTYSLEHGRGGI
jgi:hypothetical protein